MGKELVNLLCYISFGCCAIAFAIEGWLFYGFWKERKAKKEG